MKHYTCYPNKSFYYSGHKTKVAVDEKLNCMPYASCGFKTINTDMGRVDIFISYITPIFAVLKGKYIIRLKDFSTVTTSRQITAALRELYYYSYDINRTAYLNATLLLMPGHGLAVNLLSGDYLDISNDTVKKLLEFKPDYEILD